MPDSPRQILEDIYHAAVRAADPATALVSALDGTGIDSGNRLFLVSLGKASPLMAEAALAWLQAHHKPVSGGIVVSSAPVAVPRLPLKYHVGDHPLPGPASFAAADALERMTLELRTEDEVWVLLSGGTSSLVAAPVPGVAPADFVELYRLLLGSGFDIHDTNLVRKRVSRWGAGRLALALSPARVRVFVMSDVPGDDLATIGSGPCAPDPSSAAELRTMLGQRGWWSSLPPTVSMYVDDVIAGRRGETPKFDDPRFSRVHTDLIANNRTALEGAAARAAELAVNPVIEPALSGDATEAGSIIASRLIHALEAGEPGCFLWGGETTVTLDPAPGQSGRGGRCQDLALSAAIRLAESGVETRVTLLAAGTDGRDGPTDAAGAVVDGHTAARIVNPHEYLSRHDSYPALHQARGLFQPGPTGTNVMDIVLGLVKSEE